MAESLTNFEYVPADLTQVLVWGPGIVTSNSESEGPSGSAGALHTECGHHHGQNAARLDNLRTVKRTTFFSGLTRSHEIEPPRNCAPTSAHIVSSRLGRSMAASFRPKRRAWTSSKKKKHCGKCTANFEVA